MHAFQGTYLAHQRAGIDFMLHRERKCAPAGGILADEPGLGKTIMAIGVMLENPCMRPSLVVCPKAVQQQWVSELLKFGGLKAVILQQAACLRKFTEAAGAGMPLPVIGILSYTQLSHYQRNPLVGSLLGCCTFGRAVFDEGHMLRNPQSKAHKAALLLKAQHKWVLSGTPLVNKAADAWALLQLLGSARTESPPQLAVIRRVLKPIMLRRTTHDIASSLPRLHMALERVRFDSQEEAELYAKVEAHCRHRAWVGMRSGNDIMVMEALTRCRQMAIHPELVIRGLGRKSFKDALSQELPAQWPFMSTKLRHVAGIAAQHCGTEKVLVLCSFIEEMQLIAAVLQQLHGLDALSYSGKLQAGERQAVVDAFNGKDGARVLLVQVQAGGTGLNLQAASRVIVSSMPWTPSLESQGIHRAFRLEGGAVVSVRCERQDKRLALKDTIQGKCVKSLSMGEGRKPLVDVAVKDMVAYAARNDIPGGCHLTEDWLLRKHFMNNIEVVFADGNAAHASPSNLRVVMAQSVLDVPRPALPRLCFAQAGLTICGQEAVTGGHTCSLHTQHEAVAAKGFEVAQLCIFEVWLTAKHAAAAAAYGDDATTCRGCQDDPTQCKPCLSQKIAEVGADIRRALAGTSRRNFNWALSPMYALFPVRGKPDAPRHHPHSGCCLAFPKGGSRFCLKPVWQHDGQVRLLCMDHLIEHAAKCLEVEEAVKLHLSNYALYLKNRELQASRNPFVNSAKFNSLMGRPF
ncbi:hypothetical protein OEZ85_011017 [Tetradesmus obliquus]|uniref:SNF2 super family n=1 Tax=Tetradesmus obliquus TaxID=3088 RepID=A0ABY8TRC1_TETOB|nr:hypothetical protein OEZ85_011017 [Tetradesmus obliquus]